MHKAVFGLFVQLVSCHYMSLQSVDQAFLFCVGDRLLMRAAGCAAFGQLAVTVLPHKLVYCPAHVVFMQITGGVETVMVRPIQYLCSKDVSGSIRWWVVLGEAKKPEEKGQET